MPYNLKNHPLNHKKHTLFSVLFLGASCLPLCNTYAMDANTLPSNGNVVAGDANLDYQGNQLDILQNTDRVVIDWDSFDIGVNAGVEFFQPDSGSIAVNRAVGVGQDPTQILGSLKANGIVVVLDRNGVVFGQGSRVDVSGLVVSTGDIDQDAFMNGANTLQLQNVNQDATIELNGNITIAEAGLAAFVAPTVRNNGVITAKMGRVALASGETATLDLYGDGLIEIAANDALTGALVENKGTIDAHGGTVHLTVPMVESVVDNLINMDGVIDVSSATQKGGKIVLEGGNASVSGTLNADGKTGGGTIHVGGEYQGKGDTLRAQTTIVSADALLSANSTDHGDGGEIIIWADRATRYEGNIEAKGGPNGGNGGFAEISGKNYLEFAGDVDLSGDTLGTLLLDPDDIDIVAGTANPAEFADYKIYFAENSGLTSTIGAGTLSGRLSANANVILQANNTIDVDADITSTGIGDLTLETAAGGTITVNNAIDVNTGNLTLKADEIDIFANLSGSGDIELTSADINQEIEIGSTDATDLNLTATELGFLQDGWNQVTLGDSDHTATIAINEAISFSDHLNLINSPFGAITAPIDINASITTTDNSNLTLQGKANPAGVHGFKGVHVGADLNIAGDLIVDAIAGSSYETSSIMVGGDVTIDHTNAGVLDANFTVGGNFTFLQVAKTFNLEAGRTLDVAGNISIDAGSNTGDSEIALGAGSALQADGNITLESETVTFDATSSISGNADGSSNLIFLEGGQDGAMEIGGTSEGHDWQLTTAEVSTIQDGFSSITFGSSTNTEAIDVTGAVSFSDNINLLNTGDDGKISFTDTFTTTDGANLNVESGTAANVGYDAIDIDADMTIAGDLTLKTGAGGGDGHVDINNTNLNVAGNFTVGSGNDGYLTSTNLSVGGNFTTLDDDLDGATSSKYDLTFTNADINGDLNISADKRIRLYGSYDVDGDINITNIDTNEDIFIFDDLSSNGNITIRATGDIDINDDITTQGGNIILNADRDVNQNGAVDIANATITTNGGNFTAGGGLDPTTTAAYGNASYDSGVRLFSTSSINTGAGTIQITGHGNDDNTQSGQYGINLTNNSTLTTTSGDIKLSGFGGESSNNSYGVNIIETTISTQTGFIDIEAEAGLAPSNDAAFVIFNNSILESTGSGSIRVKATGTVNSVDFNVGTAGAQRIGSSTMTGDITILADDMNLAETDNTVITQGDIFITPNTASTSIDLGTNSSGDFQISDNELGQINAGGKLVIGNSASGTGDIVIRSWDLSAKDYNVELYGNDFDIGGVTLGAGDFLAHAMDNGGDDGDIVITDNFTRGVNGTATLDLRADRNISNTSSAGITASDANSDGDNDPLTDADTLNVILNADRDEDQDGAISLTDATITTNGGNFTAGGGDDPANDFAYGNTTLLRGIEFDNTSISTAQGAIALNGHGRPLVNATLLGGVYLLNGSAISTTSGNIDIKGQSTSTGNNIRAIYLSSSQIDTDTGAITLTANKSGSTASSYGIELDAGDILVDGSGTIELDVTAETNDILTNATSTIGGTDADGDITFSVDTASIGNTVQTTGNITIAPKTDGISIGLGTSSGNLSLDDTELSYFNAGGKLIIGSQSTTNNLLFINSWDRSAQAFDAEINATNIQLNGLTLGAGDTTLNATQDIIVNNPVGNSGAGGDVVLVATNNFTNNAGANALDTGSGARFLVYASDADTSLTGGITGNFIYAQTFATLAPASVPTGSSLIFASSAPPEAENNVEATSDSVARIQNSITSNFESNTSSLAFSQDETGTQDSLINVNGQIASNNGNTKYGVMSCLVSYAETSVCAIQ